MRKKHRLEHIDFLERHIPAISESVCTVVGISLVSLQAIRAMGKFADLFRRKARQQKVVHSASQPKENGQKDVIMPNFATRPVAGMQRNSQGGYIATYTAVQPQSRLMPQSSDSSTDTDSSRTAVDNLLISKHGEGPWKGKPIGQMYDRREELTAEDEDMWAKMAM